MKNRVLMSLGAIALIVGLFAFGCKKEETTNTETTSTDMSSTSSTTAPATDTTATSAMATDSTGTPAATTSVAATPLSGDDMKFAEKAAIGGMAEVSLGGSVSPKAANPDVKAFADRMVSDHSKANDELKQLATAKGATLPADTDEKNKKAAEKVLASKNLDKAYMSDMVKDHDEDVKEFEEASNKVKDADLKAWIDKTLPVLKDHQKMAHDINAKLK